MIEKLMSLDRSHFEWQFFRAGGKGGQKQNKTSSACRCVHPPSGAVGESREERQQIQNRRIAFRRCVESKQFQVWLKLQICDLEGRVDAWMAPQHIKIETYDPTTGQK